VASATDAAVYQVLVNGKAVDVESVRYEASSRAVTLSLSEGLLQAGDEVVVSWSDLRDAQGRASMEKPLHSACADSLASISQKSKAPILNESEPCSFCAQSRHQKYFVLIFLSPGLSRSRIYGEPPQKFVSVMASLLILTPPLSIS
jgi:hypothetical protein